LDGEIIIWPSYLRLDRTPLDVHVLRDIPYERHNLPNTTIHHREEGQEIEYNPFDPLDFLYARH